MSKVTLIICCAAVFFVETAMAGEIHPQRSQEEKRPVTRAEVLADLEIWNGAGMNRYPREETYPDIKQHSDYQKSLKEYHRLRSGPEFQLIVQQLKPKVGDK
ncbi:DUF4148 domain-containing protein [Comamonas testosteroni]|uniref:DUF4148 domain-containing protein n=1 Tax=Comamonas testosteroni TaxID=285 RepID=UPI0023AA9816|nr:DUF4148 domain-containing protein [Comamonas testosteroni]WEE77614.1 DUF4148 domain-containing protein [Comamonas testosteroni]